ncbi:cytochrome P450 [Perilla frutescens var. hirtella]|nr:cytochrome P450 [Perilla frutescens var. hirtella]
MMIELLFTILSLFLCVIYYFYLNPNYTNRLPRAGGALPIIGHLHLLSSKQLLHKTLAAMADKYGPVFTVKLGSRENMVVSSWETAKECFTTLDKAFADRPNITATRLLGYDGAMFGFAPYGPYWRQMRKIATLELLSHRRIDMMSHIRASELQASLKELYDLWAVNGRNKGLVMVDMKQWFGDLTMNTSVRMVGGKRKDGGGRERRSGEDIHKMMREFFHYFGVFVLSDAIPSLAWLDLQGHQRSMKRKAKELDDLVGEWLEEHKEKRKTAKYKSTVVDDDDDEEEDFMDAMLTIMEGDDFPQFEADTITKATCLNIVVAGSDTTMVTLTWALSLLLNNPHTLKKAQEEVDFHISKDRHVNDSDIKNLVYLEAVVKETLRLYPAIPIISLHSALEDCTLSTGHHVPSGTRLLVNIWKIQRDEKLWEEPLEFRPERFLTSHKDLDMRSGNNFEFVPFGSGRRSCPGTSLALQIVHLTLASLLHCFEFARPNSDAEIDMTESSGLTNLKATPLEVYITPRLHHHQIFKM